MLAPAVVFLVVLVVVFGIFYAAVEKPDASNREAVWKRLTGAGTQAARRAKRSSLLRDTNEVTAVPALDRILAPLGSLLRPLAKHIEHAGLKLTVGALLLTCTIAALIVFVVAYAASGFYFLAGPLALAAAWLPLKVVKFKATKRINKFEEQFPDAIDLMTRALRAGHAFTTALSMVAEEAPEPVAGEFKRLYDEQNFGLPVPQAMRDFADRIPVLDAKFFVTAVLTQRESGGNLSEVLDNLGRVMRERFKVKRQIRVLSAHGRATAAVLMALPPTLAAFFMVLNPEHLGTLTGDIIGWWMIGGAVFLQTTGMFIIKQLINIEY